MIFFLTPFLISSPNEYINVSYFHLLMISFPSFDDLYFYKSIIFNNLPKDNRYLDLVYLYYVNKC